MSEVFLTFIITTSSGLFLAMIGLCYKSRCTRIQFCGVDITRDAVLEERIDELAITRPTTTQPYTSVS